MTDIPREIVIVMVMTVLFQIIGIWKAAREQRGISAEQASLIQKANPLVCYKCTKENEFTAAYCRRCGSILR